VTNRVTAGVCKYLRAVLLRERNRGDPASCTSSKRNTAGEPEDPRREAMGAVAIRVFWGAGCREIIQLRKQDVRQDQTGWVMRLTPEAGGIKMCRFINI